MRVQRLAGMRGNAAAWNTLCRNRGSAYVIVVSGRQSIGTHPMTNEIAAANRCRQKVVSNQWWVLNGQVAARKAAFEGFS
jgi:hypothetical protein